MSTKSPIAGPIPALALAVLALAAAALPAAGQSSVPEAPTAPTVTATSNTGGSLEVSWTAPTSGSAITDYDLRYYAGSADPTAEADWIEEGETFGPADPGTSTSGTITGLTATTAYRVQVRAANASGEGAWSSSGSGTTGSPPATNNAPRLLEQKAQDQNNNFCRVKTDTSTPSRRLPAAAGIFVSAGRFVTRISETTEWPASCTRASNRWVPIFDDLDADPLVLTMEYTLPDNVRLVSGFPRLEQPTVPPGAGSGHGRLYFSGFAALQPTEVRIDLTATDPHGASASTHIIVTANPLLNTSVPSFVSTASGRSFALNEAIAPFVLPAATGGDVSSDPPPNPYIYKVTGLPAGLSFDPSTRTVSGTPRVGGSHTVTYTAEDLDGADAGDSPDPNDTARQTFTITITGGPSGPPAAPSAPTVTATSNTGGSLEVSWTAPTSGSAITDYDLRYYAGSADPADEADWIEEGETFGPADPGTSTSGTITGLTATTAYRVQVRAANASGEGAWSSSGSGTTGSPPATNNAPRLLEQKAQDQNNNFCRVKTDTSTPSRRLPAAAGIFVSAGRFVTRISETTAWPASCTRASNRWVPIFDDLDADPLVLTMEYTLPDNVRLVSGFPRLEQPTVPPGSGTGHGRLYFSGFAALQPTEVRIDLTATDPHGASASTHIIVTANPLLNTSVPSFVSTAGARSFAWNEAIAPFVLPAATGGDVSGDPPPNPYIYKVTGLPAGLSFDPATRTVSGTPRVGGSHTVTYTAEDLDAADAGDSPDPNDTARQTFTITITIRATGPPSAPLAPTVTRASATSLSVTWTAPASTGARPVHDYDLRYYAGTSDPSNPSDWIEEGEPNGPPDPGASTSATITGLTANAAYRVQVRAEGDGESPWSASGSAPGNTGGGGGGGDDGGGGDGGDGGGGGPVTPPAPPGRGALSADGVTATVEFAYDLDVSSVPDPGDFTVELADATRLRDDHYPVTTASIRGSALDLTLSVPVPVGSDVVVSYTKGARPLLAGDGREVPDFSVTASPPPFRPPPPSNRPPAFESSEYALELPENLDGSVDPVFVGTVAATDPDGDALTYYLVWTGGERFEAGDRDGAIAYVGPGEDFEAEPKPYELALRASDPYGVSAETYVTVTVVDANDAPEAADDAAATDEDVAIEVDVLANDTDIDGDDLSVASVSAPENGTAAVTAGGVLYTPAANWHGTDSFTYTIDDGSGGTAEASVEVTVAPVNDPPEAADDAAATVEDMAVEVDVLANDTDADGDDLRVSSVSAPEHGTAAVVAGGGGVRYTPAADWHGTDGFTYTIDDGSGGTAEASVEVTVKSENDAPTAAEDEAETDEDVAVEVDVLANDTDPDGDDLRVSSVSAPSNGTAVVTAAGGVLYTPAANWHGTDSFTYAIDDGNGGTAEASVEVTVKSGNDPPEAAGDEAATDEDVAVEVAVLANDTDIDGDSLRVSSVSAPENGTAVAGAASVVRYTPDANWHGTDSFTYGIDDGNGGTAEASVTVTVRPVNDPPEAADDAAETDEDVAVTVTVLANDTDIDGDSLRVSSVSAPSNGTAAVAAGEVVYTPDANWYGTDSFTYAIDDGRGGTAEASVEVTVLPVNDPPEATDDAAATDEDRAVEVDALANDTDIDGDSLRVSSVSAPQNGTAAVVAGGRGVRYTPAADWHGTDSFTYAIDDGNGGTASASVTVTVAPVNDAPEAADDAASTPEDVAVTVDVLANDTDPDGDGLTVSSVSAPANGTAAVAAGGVRYTPAANWHGTDSFTYAIDDGNGGTAEASVEVTVLPVNDGPEAVGAIPGQTLEEGGEPSRIDLDPFFADTDGDALEYGASSSDPSVVEASVSGSVLTLVPAGYGTAEVTVTAADAGGLTATQTVSVGVSDRPAREAVSHALAGLARGHLASVRMTLGRRAKANRHESSRLTLLGRKVPLATGSARSTAEQMWSSWLSGVTSRTMSQATPYASPGAPGFGAGVGGTPMGAGATMDAGAAMGAPGTMSPIGGPNAAGRAGSGDDMGLGDLFRLGDLVRLQGGRDPLQGSEFLLALGGGQEAGGGGGGVRLQLWGQGDVQTFQGAPSDASDYDGELRTGYVGVDTWLTDRWLLGVAVARSEGTGGWRAGSASGSLDTRLLAVHPYLRWSNGATSIWATGGAGWGDAENVRDRGGPTEMSELGLRLGLVELRQRLASGGGFEFGLRADAGWAELATDSGTETLDGQTAAVNQARFGIEMSQSLRLGGLTLTPFGEANARRDGGDGQTGDGLELAGGLRARAGFLRIDAQGRMLAVHSAAGYEERGLAVTLSLGNPGGEGASLSMSPRWGDAATGGDALWRDQIESRYAPAQVMAVGEPTADGSGIAHAVRDPWALDLRGGYGLRIPGDRLLTWTGSFNHSAAGPRFTLGAQIGVGFGRSSGEEP